MDAALQLLDFPTHPTPREDDSIYKAANTLVRGSLEIDDYQDGRADYSNDSEASPRSLLSKKKSGAVKVEKKPLIKKKAMVQISEDSGRKCSYCESTVTPMVF